MIDLGGGRGRVYLARTCIYIFVYGVGGAPGLHEVGERSG